MKTKNFDFAYNAVQEPILLREYGRNIQNMIHHVADIKDRDKRNACAKEIVRLMKHFNPELKDKEDHIRKLWDYLFIVTDFKIDIDSPFPVPKKELLNRKPERVPYATHRLAYKHYGRTVELLIQKAIELDPSPLKEKMVHYIGCLMKMFYKIWNKDNVTNESIAEHLAEMSKNKLKLDIKKFNIDLLSEATHAVKSEDKKQFRHHRNFNPSQNNNYQNRRNFQKGKNDNNERYGKNQSKRNFPRSSGNYPSNNRNYNK